jgi:hypothetical protein
MAQVVLHKTGIFLDMENIVLSSSGFPVSDASLIELFEVCLMHFIGKPLMIQRLLCCHPFCVIEDYEVLNERFWTGSKGFPDWGTSKKIQIAFGRKLLRVKSCGRNCEGTASRQKDNCNASQ